MRINKQVESRVTGTLVLGVVLLILVLYGVAQIGRLLASLMLGRI